MKYTSNGYLEFSRDLAEEEKGRVLDILGNELFVKTNYIFFYTDNIINIEMCPGKLTEEIDELKKYLSGLAEPVCIMENSIISYYGDGEGRLSFENDEIRDIDTDEVYELWNTVKQKIQILLDAYCPSAGAKDLMELGFSEQDIKDCGLGYMLK